MHYSCWWIFVIVGGPLAAIAVVSDYGVVRLDALSHGGHGGRRLLWAVNWLVVMVGLKCMQVVVKHWLLTSA